MSNVDISVAVATKSGLITPIVKNTPYLSVNEISDTVKVLYSYCSELFLIFHENSHFSMRGSRGGDRGEDLPEKSLKYRVS